MIVDLRMTLDGFWWHTDIHIYGHFYLYFTELSPIRNIFLLYSMYSTIQNFRNFCIHTMDSEYQIGFIHISIFSEIKVGNVKLSNLSTTKDCLLSQICFCNLWKLKIMMVCWREERKIYFYYATCWQILFVKWLWMGLER